MGSHENVLATTRHNTAIVGSMHVDGESDPYQPDVDVLPSKQERNARPKNAQNLHSFNGFFRCHVTF